MLEFQILTFLFDNGLAEVDLLRAQLLVVLLLAIFIALVRAIIIATVLRVSLDLMRVSLLHKQLVLFFLALREALVTLSLRIRVNLRRLLLFLVGKPASGGVLRGSFLVGAKLKLELLSNTANVGQSKPFVALGRGFLLRFLGLAAGCLDGADVSTASDLALS